MIRSPKLLSADNDNFKLKTSHTGYFQQKCCRIKNVCETIVIKCPGNYKLAENICASGHNVGIIIDSDNVVLNLNGFSLFAGGGRIGIRIENDRKRIIIKDGYIEDFSQAGILGLGNTNVTIDNVVLINNAFSDQSLLGVLASILFIGGDNNSIKVTHSSVQNSNATLTATYGILINDASNSSVIDSSVTGSSGLAQAITIILKKGVGKIEKCTLSNNTNLDGGVNVFGASTTPVLALLNNNIVSNNSFVQVVQNNPATVVAFACDSVIDGNEVTGNTFDSEVTSLIFTFVSGDNQTRTSTVQNNILTDNTNNFTGTSAATLPFFSGIDFVGTEFSFQSINNTFSKNISNTPIRANRLLATPGPFTSNGTLVIDRLISNNNSDGGANKTYSSVSVERFDINDPFVFMRVITRNSTSSNNRANLDSVVYDASFMINSEFENNTAIGNSGTAFRYQGGGQVSFDSNQADYNDFGFITDGDINGTFTRNTAVQNLNNGNISFNSGSAVQNISIPPLVP